MEGLEASWKRISTIKPVRMAIRSVTGAGVSVGQRVGEARPPELHLSELKTQFRHEGVLLKWLVFYTSLRLHQNSGNDPWKHSRNRHAELMRQDRGSHATHTGLAGERHRGAPPPRSGGFILATANEISPEVAQGKLRNARGKRKNPFSSPPFRFFSGEREPLGAT